MSLVAKEPAPVEVEGLPVVFPPHLTENFEKAEAQIKELMTHIESTHQQLTRLDSIEQHLSDLTAFAHASMDAEARRVAGISDGLLRLSVGIESGDDLVRDLVGALDHASAALRKAKTAQVTASQRAKQRHPNSLAARI